MKSKQIDPGADTIQYIGDTALDAAGVGFAAPLWDLFFPQGEPLFSLAPVGVHFPKLRRRPVFDPRRIKHNHLHNLSHK